MDKGQALRILNLDTDFSPKSIQLAFEARNLELDERIASAPTEALRSKFLEKKNTLIEARIFLSVSDNVGKTISNFPVLNNIQSEFVVPDDGTSFDFGKELSGGSLDIGDTNNYPDCEKGIVCSEVVDKRNDSLSEFKKQSETGNSPEISGESSRLIVVFVLLVILIVSVFLFFDSEEQTLESITNGPDIASVEKVGSLSQAEEVDPIELKKEASSTMPPNEKVESPKESASSNEVGRTEKNRQRPQEIFSGVRVNYSASEISLEVDAAVEKRGLVIRSVDRGSVAAKTSIPADFVITHINDFRVKNLEDTLDYIANLDGNVVLLSGFDNDHPNYFALPIRDR